MVSLDEANEALTERVGAGIAEHPEAMKFIKWQCRVRQDAMRLGGGRPDEGSSPELLVRPQRSKDDAQSENRESWKSVGKVTTILNRSQENSAVSELTHITSSNADPAQRLTSAIRFLSSQYYQKWKEFSPVLTATFARGMQLSAHLKQSSECMLVFDAFSQKYNLQCTAVHLTQGHYLHSATMAHNRPFNPYIGGDVDVIGFVVDWEKSQVA